MQLRKITFTAAVITLLLAAPALFAQSNQTLKKTVKKDTETMINVHVNAFKPSSGQLNCNQGGTVVLDVVTPPKNGKVTTRPTKAKDKDCTNELMGTGIYYTPNPGFTGTDTFTYSRTDQGMRETTKAGGPQGTRVVTIEVKS
jgi:hypothetical protein